ATDRGNPRGDTITASPRNRTPRISAVNPCPWDTSAATSSPPTTRNTRAEVHLRMPQTVSSTVVIPETWLESRRDEDGELLGFLRPGDASGDASGGAPGQFVPVTVFGYPLGPAGDEDDAQRVLEAVGLSYLADRWSLALDGRPDPIAVQIVEASPQQ